MLSTVLAATDGIPLAHTGEFHPVEAAALALIVAVPVIAIVLAVVLGGRMLAKVEAAQAEVEANNSEIVDAEDVDAEDVDAGDKPEPPPSSTAS